ncbi:RagB/SusD family nutrient uptake outer membrane protein [Anaerophaga thermohalophila]|uniref:RagB/SusD family nutrient uptake outer membrane protein n=1 Tax=Anaerophaga thermohalophila TaxID=177400 RepID=UPI000237BB25|nr:RagB/SusD family nutrient uptake outer membrane protein [Anaerophaga thermohalophila]
MRKIIYMALAVLAVMAFTSCEDFLNKEPIDQLGEGSFYSNDEELNMAVMACYSDLRNLTNEEWRLTEIRSDNSRLYIKNTGDAVNVRLRQLDNFTVETTHDENTEYWEDAYKVIDDCNVVLENINVVENSDLKDQLEGEVRFIRAYVYFNLVRLYGPVFLVTERLDIDEGNTLPRSSVQDVYDVIENDLILAGGTSESSGLLPDGYDSSQLGRATSWAAKTLLGKVYLTLHRYSDAKDILIDVKDNSGHQLLDNYSDIFDVNNEMNSEIIFAVRYLSGGYGQGSPFANYFSPRDGTFVPGRAYNYNTPTNDLIEAYDLEGDTERKNVVLIDIWTDDSGNLNPVPFVSKYLSDFENDLDAENDWIVLRYADVLLMLAEAENEISGISEALPYVNSVRTRAGLNLIEESSVDSKWDMKLIIENERRLEFAFENHRFYDLVRTNRLATVMKNHYDNEIIITSISQDGTMITEPYYANVVSDFSYLPEDARELDEWQFLLPIPNSVMTVGTNATQNPGY